MRGDVAGVVRVILIHELKTTSEDIAPGSTYWRRLTLDSQVSGYLAAAHALGYDAAGVQYDVIRKTGLRGKQNETPDSYEQRIVQQIAEEPDRYFGRGVIVRTEAEIAEHAADVWQVAELIRAARSSNRWPRYVGACMTYNTPCDYWAVCAEGGDIEGPLYKTSPPMTGARLPVLSASALNTWRQCPRKYYYSQELRRRRVSGESKPLWFGKLIHNAVQVYNASGSADQAMAIVSDCADAMDRAHGRALMRGYTARWVPLKMLATEQQFNMPMVNPDTGAPSRTFECGGFVDGIVEVENG